MEYSIVYKTKPTAEEVTAIATLLQQFNFSHGPACTGIWLSTPDFPPGGHLTFMQKRLTKN